MLKLCIPSHSPALRPTARQRLPATGRKTISMDTDTAIMNNAINWPVSRDLRGPAV